MSPVYCALVHHPVLDRRGEVVATALTNLDVHDLSRASRTYGLSGFYVVSPVEAQQKIVGAITSHWGTGAGKDRVPERSEALALCAPAASIEEACARIAEREGQAPQRWVTSARPVEGARLIPWGEARRILADTDVPILILFGTGHGLAPEALESADAALPPIQPGGGYNHLSVRAAAAITLDRLLASDR